MTKQNNAVDRLVPTSELEYADSDYLCHACHELLYEEIGASNNPKIPICVNKQCKDCTRMKFYDPEVDGHGKPQPYLAATDARKGVLISKISTFDKAFTYRYLYGQRKNLCQGLFERNRLSLNILGIDYLFTLLFNVTSWETNKNEKELGDLVTEFLNFFDEFTMVAGIRSRDYLLADERRIFIPKYSAIIQEIRKSMGMINEQKDNPSDVHSYYFIDSQVSIQKEFSENSENQIERLYEKHFYLPIMFQQIFKLNYLAAEIHKYPALTLDFATIFALMNLLFQGRKSVTGNELKQLYIQLARQNKSKDNLKQFLDDYVSGKVYAPILVSDGTLIHFDFATLFIYGFYLLSLNTRKEGRQTQTGQEVILDKKNEAALVFERVLRQHCRSKGMDVYPVEGNEPLIIKKKGGQKEYDCIAIDNSNQVTYLISAKYQDPSTSSLNAKRLLRQELLDKKDGILAYAIEEEEHHHFFREDFAELPSQFQHTRDYKIRSMVVTKHEPLINMYKNTDLMSYTGFLKLLEKSYPPSTKPTQE